LSASLTYRPRRYPLIAAVELVDLKSAARMQHVISDLSRFGCHISTQQMWPIGSTIAVSIVHNDKTFSATAQVIYGQPMLGMGVMFTEVQPDNRAVLETWIAELQNAMKK
jgi:PilZ domain